LVLFIVFKVEFLSLSIYFSEASIAR